MTKTCMYIAMSLHTEQSGRAHHMMCLRHRIWILLCTIYVYLVVILIWRFGGVALQPPIIV